MAKKTKVYYPGEKFPVISVTGRKCELKCPHCEAKYLRHMIDGSGGLYETVSALYEKGISGALISGGCDKFGKVPISWEEVRKIKRDFGIKVNAHVGIISKDEVKEIASSEVDVISFDFIPNRELVKRIYGISVEENWAVEVLKEFEKEGIRYSPHITVGLNWGHVGWEYEALEALEDRSFEVLVLNVLIPTKGTEMERVPYVPLREFSKVLYAAKKLRKEISLGCMRPRGIGYERIALKVGVERIVLPPRKVNGKFEIIEACCVI